MTYVREDTVENYLRKRVEKRGGIAYKFTSPGRKGVPDRMCVFPGGHLFFIETKAPKGGRLEPWQKREIRRIRKAGINVYVAPTKKRVDEVLELECD